MTGYRFHLLSLQTFRAILALLVLTSIYSCSGRSVSDTQSSINSKKPVGKMSPNKTAVSKPVAQTPAIATYHFDKPEHVKGLYWTAWTAGMSSGRARMFAIIDKTDINAVVIDVRDDGQMYFKNSLPLAAESGANKTAVGRPAVLFKSLVEHKVWPIARIACFRDNYVTKKHPELAIQFPDGKPWHDRRNYYWLDPYNKKNWDYLASVVDSAIDLGFPEIQLDYVRFPSEGKAATQVFPAKAEYAKSGEVAADVIAAFTKFIGERVHKRKALFSVDIFGIISSTKGDEGIGQQLEKVSASFDVLSPMIYPSHFAKGEYGIKNPNYVPYDIIKKSLNDYKKRLPTVTIRPWLQAFTLGPPKYGAPELKAQIKAAKDVGYQGYLIWNAQNRYPYVAEALGPKSVK